MPDCLILSSMAENLCLYSASAPFVGSSRSRISAPYETSFAMAAFCLSPPDKSNGCRESRWESPNSSAVLSALSPSSSRRVSLLKRSVGSCGRNPSLPPFMLILPADGFSVPQIRFNSVDFPAPFPPIMAVAEPRFISSDKFLTVSLSLFL